MENTEIDLDAIETRLRSEFEHSVGDLVAPMDMSTLDGYKEINFLDAHEFRTQVALTVKVLEKKLSLAKDVADSARQLEIVAMVKGDLDPHFLRRFLHVSFDAPFEEVRSHYETVVGQTRALLEEINSPFSRDGVLLEIALLDKAFERLEKMQRHEVTKRLSYGKLTEDDVERLIEEDDDGC